MRITEKIIIEILTDRLPKGEYDGTSNECCGSHSEEYIVEQTKNMLKTEEGITISPADIGEDEAWFFVDGLWGTFSLYTYGLDNKEEWCLVYDGWDDDGEVETMLDTIGGEYNILRDSSFDMGLDIVDLQDIDKELYSLVSNYIKEEKIPLNDRTIEEVIDVYTDLLEQQYQGHL